MATMMGPFHQITDITKWKNRKFGEAHLYLIWLLTLHGCIQSYFGNTMEDACDDEETTWQNSIYCIRCTQVVSNSGLTRMAETSVTLLRQWWVTLGSFSTDMCNVAPPLHRYCNVILPVMGSFLPPRYQCQFRICMPCVWFIYWRSRPQMFPVLALK